MNPAREHRWGGWPQNRCLDCGHVDRRPKCAAAHDVATSCIHGHFLCEQGHPPRHCPEHANPPCPGPRGT